MREQLIRKFSNNIGHLQPPDENGISLPEGFRSRIVARSGQKPLAFSGYHWHYAPDGGAVFETENKGWIYVSNSEMADGEGGVGALEFDQHAQLVDAYSICDRTNKNCAGGPTPWGTWLTCEEISRGRVLECDPSGKCAPQPLLALGRFRHEAVTVDSDQGVLYLTEDERDGRLYRFRPEAKAIDRLLLDSGVLEAAQVIGEQSAVIWHAIPDPSATVGATRRQIQKTTPFKGGEGIWYHKGTVYFSTKGDNRIWALNTENDVLSIIYDDDYFEKEQLTGVDNITVSSRGDVFVAEDGGDMQIIAITPFRKILPILKIVGHDDSEITGPAFDPSGTRLYFSSQRGSRGVSEDGVTFEVTGPFLANLDN
jgi:secreted PhoX family phosphatase